MCPLDWGLGHATRCVPLIRELILQDAEVIVAASNGPFNFLKKEFPRLQFIYFEGYNTKYDQGNASALKMFLSIPKIIYHIFYGYQILFLCNNTQSTLPHCIAGVQRAIVHFHHQCLCQAL